MATRYRAALLGVGVAALIAPGAQAGTYDRWVQYGADDTVLLRAITDAQACPTASVNGVPVALGLRASPSAAFPVRLCEAVLPRTQALQREGAAGGAAIDGVALQLPRSQPRRIVVMGDTGCRIKGAAVQDCNDPAAFPLARLASVIAALRPDLIVHVGDYHYREAACPSGHDGCRGSPAGDAWDSWRADWFDPARPILAAAPLALSRGNHESCGRGQLGWFTLLDARPFDAGAAACARGSAYDTTAPYVVAAGGVALLMFDISFAQDALADATTLATYRGQLAGVLAGIGGPAIFVTHKPAFGLISVGAGRPGGAGARVAGGNATEQALFADGVPPPIRLLLSGHIHDFQAVQLADPAFAPQLVVGDSGTALDPVSVPGDMRGATFATAGGTAATIAGTADIADFGFAVLDAEQDGFDVTLYGLAGEPRGHCAIRLEPRRLACAG